MTRPPLSQLFPNTHSRSLTATCVFQHKRRTGLPRTELALTGGELS